MRRALILSLWLCGVAQAQPAPEAGTTIVGEQESAVGLYLTPWQDEYASDLDRPPSRLVATPQPLAAAAYIRRSDAEATLQAYRREQLQRVH